MNEKPVIRVWISRPSNAYYNMSEEQRILWDKLAKKYKELGIKTIVECKSNWSNEEWVGFGVGEFPDIGTVQMLARFQLEELEWPRFFFQDLLRRSLRRGMGAPKKGALTLKVEPVIGGHTST